MTADELLRWAYRHQVTIEFDREDDADYCRIRFRTASDRVAVARVWLRNHDNVVDDVTELAEKGRDRYALE